MRKRVIMNYRDEMDANVINSNNISEDTVASRNNAILLKIEELSTRLDEALAEYRKWQDAVVKLRNEVDRLHDFIHRERLVDDEDECPECLKR